MLSLQGKKNTQVIQVRFLNEKLSMEYGVDIREATQDSYDISIKVIAYRMCCVAENNWQTDIHNSLLRAHCVIDYTFLILILLWNHECQHFCIKGPL